MAMMYHDVDWVQSAALEQELMDDGLLSEGDSFDVPQDLDASLVEVLDQFDGRHSAGTPAADPVAIYLDNLFCEADESDASDIHFEWSDSTCQIRMRVGGVLCSLEPPANSLVDGVVRRLKQRSKINVSRRQTTSEGEFVVDDKSALRVRVRCFPSVDGEKIVMRLVRASTLKRRITQLGMSKQQLDNYQRALTGSGLVVFAGPTRSGKTTTLYSTIHALQNARTSIATVEAHVDMRLSGVFQRQVAKLNTQDQAWAVRDLLYQDADVIVAADVEGRQTTNVCVQAATMGRQVLMSMHANDAFSTLARLRNMVDPTSVLSEILRASIAQHLLRRLCDHCKKPTRLSKEKAKRYSIAADQDVFQAAGCDHCHGTGYRGYVAVFEVLRFNQELRNLLCQNATIREIQHAAMQSGMTLMGNASRTRIIAGETSLDEALKLRYRC